MSPSRDWLTKLALLCTLGVLTVASSFAGQMHQNFADLLADSPRDEYLPGIVVLSEQVDLQQIEREIADSGIRSRAYRHELVVSSAQDLAARTQIDLLADLNGWMSDGSVRMLRSYWVINAIYVEALPEVFELIAPRDDVEVIHDDKEANLRQALEITDGPMTTPPRDDLPTNLVCIDLEPVWDLGVRGQGRLVATMDSGAEGTHEAFGDRWRGHDAGVNWWEAWFDPHNSTTFPEDVRTHGTHVMGILTGEKPDGTPIGVAPEAKWICAAATAVWNLSKVIESYEWVADPDGNAQTIEDVPDVVNCSWGYTIECDDVLWFYIDLVEAAGIVNVIAVNNDQTGPNPYSVKSPESRAAGNLVNWGVGFVNSHLPNYPIEDESGRGPSPCDSVSIKPNLTAPGTDIYSSKLDNDYRTLSGTSMAAPHVSGSAALLRQIDPDLTVNEIKSLLMATAVDKGSVGPDNDYGWGIVNIGAAVDSFRSTLARPAPADLIVTTVAADTIFLQWDRPESNPYYQPNSYLLYRAHFASEFPDTAMAEVFDSLGVVYYRDEGVPFDSLKYRVSAVYDHGEGEPSDSVAVLEDAWMVPPLNLTASVEIDTATVEWERSKPLHPDNEPDSYRLYRALVGEEFPDSALTEIPDSVGTYGFTDYALPPGVYKYAATAIYGTVESDTSVNAIAPIYPRNPPENVVANLAAGGVHLEWDRPFVDPGNPLETYLIYRAPVAETLPDTAFAEIVDSLGTVTFVDSAATFEDLRYAVQAIYETAASDTSDHAIVTEEMWLIPPPGLMVTSVVDDTIGLGWERPVPVHPDNPLLNYRLFRAPVGQEFGVEPIAEIVDSLGTIAYVDSGVPFDSLKYAVTAVYQIAESDTSINVVVGLDTWMAPPALVITSVDADTVDLEWDRPDVIHPDNPLLHYRLYRAPWGDEFSGNMIAEVYDGLDVVAYIDSGVPFDSLRYAVTAVYQTDESDTSNHATLTPEDWMQVPTGLQASVVVDTVTLEWERPAPVHPENKLLTYRLFRTPVGEEFGETPIAEVVDSLGVFAYIDSGVAPDSHLYAVSALYEAAETELSDEALAVVYRFDPPEDLVFWASADSITLQWERPDTVDVGNQLLLYRIYRALLSQEFPDAPLDEVTDSADVITFIDPEVPLDDYHYVVTALYETTESANSNEIEVTQEVWLTPPQNANVAVVADTVTISWDRPATVHPDNQLQLYRVFRALLGEEFGAEPIAEVIDSSQTAAYVDSGVPYADLHYAVTALYELAESDTSNHVEVTRQETWSSPPDNLVLTSIDVDTVRFQWERPGPTHPFNALQYYRVFRALLGEPFGVTPIIELADAGEVVAYADSAVDFASYHYAITAQYSYSESDYSNDLEVPEDVWLPAPENLVAWVQSDTVYMQWERPEGFHPDNDFEYYRVYRAPIDEPYTPWSTYSVDDENDLVEFLDTNVDYETYKYVVTSYFEDGESVPSNEVEVIVYSPEGVDDLAAPLRQDLHIRPNPFNPVTTIEYVSVGTEPVRLIVYSVTGRRVLALVDSDESIAGPHVVEWNGTDQSGRPVASGIYLLRLDQAGQSLTRRLVLLK